MSMSDGVEISSENDSALLVILRSKLRRNGESIFQPPTGAAGRHQCLHFFQTL